MASLPTAYASQRFGRKSLDFYAAAGDVIGADPRARADERRLQDLEGARHTVRLMEGGFRLEPGDQASVLRMQPGPARRSRPVAVVNHTHGAWSRTHPGATGLLAKAGVARTWNWALTLMLFAVAALATVWPFLRAFLVEIDPVLFGAAPEFDIFALAAGAAPAIADWRIAELTGGVSAQLAQIAPGLEAFTTPIVFGGAVLLGALMVYALRSWRLIWAPVFVVALGVGAMGFDGVSGAVTPALAGLGGATVLFLIAGLINRVRDAARLERRIAILADHILRNPAEELVAGSEAVVEEAVETAELEAEAEPEDHSTAPAAAAAAAAYRSTDDRGGDDAVEAEAEIATDAETEGVTEAATPAETEAAAQADAPAEAPEPGEERAEAAQTVEEGLAAPEGAELEQGTDEEPAEAASEALDAPLAPTETTPEDQIETAAEAASEAPDAPLVPTETTPEAQAEAAAEAGPDAAGPVAEPAADSSEAEGADEPADTPNTFEQEESERLRTDPRYASRAIVLPPPPPMPGASEETGAADAPRSLTRTLQPEAPLPSNVVPMFAAPAPERKDEESVD
ncbi:MAG: hypothetical protein NXI12_05630 [Alphaproteobacteria bacterium]|nr:hypothetical protein [Alphaproteobacteria bacterium]